MSDEQGSGTTRGPAGHCEDFFRHLYDAKAEYVARRHEGSLEARLIKLEVDAFKVPNLVSVIPGGFKYSSVVEIGCATGELLAAFPAPANAQKIGFDISPANIDCARRRNPSIDFRNADFRSYEGTADLVVLSDVLEHVADDRAMLEDAGRLGRLLVINLPLEDNWLNHSRAYGPDDVSGHLRRYSLDEGLSLIEAAGLHLLEWRRVWIHETESETLRRRLRRTVTGSAFTGGRLANAAKYCAWSAAKVIRPLGRRIFASNLFACAVPRTPP